VPNKGGGRVWLSTYRINGFDFVPLARAEERQGRVIVLSGAHGDQDLGILKPNPGVFGADKWIIKQRRIDAKVIDVMKLPDSKLQQILNSDARVICAWCYGTRIDQVLDMFMLGR